MLEGMDAQELAGWLAWERVNGPLGSVRVSIEGAALRCLIANMFGGKRTELADWMVCPTPLVRKRHTAEGPEAIVRYFRMLAGAQAKGQ